MRVVLTIAKQAHHSDIIKRFDVNMFCVILYLAIEFTTKGVINMVITIMENSGVRRTLLTNDSENIYVEIGLFR